MTPLLLVNARLIDPEAGTDSPGWLLIGPDGRIADKGGREPPAIEGARRLNCQGDALAPGIVDMLVHIGEPGARHKESYRSIGEAAAAGGVTTLCPQPDDAHAIDEPEVVEFIRRRAWEVCKVHVRPMAALTRNRAGREMSEHGFLLDAGACALSDGARAVESAAVMRRCLSYAGAMGALVCAHPQEPSLSAQGCATEGVFATWKGLPGVPREAEAIQLTRDLRLTRLTGARYHAAQISTAEALGPLRRAKEQGLKVSASVSIAHIGLNELDIADFRSFCKVEPPLRAEEDRAAMVEALAEGLIDGLVSGHRPQDEESKRLPYAQAASGSVAVETLLPVALALVHNGDMTLPTLFARLSLAPARLLGLECGRLSIGAPADLAQFDMGAPWIIDRKALRSKSKNSAFDGRRVQGRVRRCFVGGKLVHEA